MAETSRIANPQYFADTCTFQQPPNLPANSISNTQIKSDPTNPIDAEKVEREFNFGHETPIGSAVTAFSLVKHIPRNSGELVAVEIAVETIPTGDNKITIDVERWTGTAWSSLLAAAKDVDSTITANTPVSVTLAATPTFADGELIRITGTLGGSTGTHAKGLRVQVTARERP